jgi:hypothetical protein
MPSASGKDHARMKELYLILSFVLIIAAIVVHGCINIENEHQSCTERGGVLLNTQAGLVCIKKDAVL